MMTYSEVIIQRGSDGKGEVPIGNGSVLPDGQGGPPPNFSSPPPAPGQDISSPGTFTYKYAKTQPTAQTVIYYIFKGPYDSGNGDRYATVEADLSLNGEISNIHFSSNPPDSGIIIAENRIELPPTLK